MTSSVLAGTLDRPHHLFNPLQRLFLMLWSGWRLTKTRYQVKPGPRSTIAQKRRRLAISDITPVELATLANEGRIHLGISLEFFLQGVEARFVVQPISSRACVRAIGLPAAHPKDPADRGIGATALVEGPSLLTADREIRRSKALQPIW